MIGSNDRQAITEKGASLPPRSPEWNEEYQKRVTAFIKVINDKHFPLVWIGQPPFRPKGMSQDMLALNEIYRTATEKAGGKFADVWDGFVDEEGNFTQTGFDINGQTARLRGNDGINITSAGKRKLAFYAEKPLRAYLGGAKKKTSLYPPQALATRPNRLIVLRRSAFGTSTRMKAAFCLAAASLHVRKIHARPGMRASLHPDGQTIFPGHRRA